MSLNITKESIYNCTKCDGLLPRPDLKPRWGTEIGKGKKIMVIGEAPGCTSKQVDYDKETFYEDYNYSIQNGLISKYMNAILLSLHMNIDDCFVTHLVKCPHGSEKPTEQLINNCKLYTYIQQNMCKPDCVILLGKLPVQHFLNMSTVVSNHASLFNSKALRYNYIASVHPYYWSNQEFGDKIELVQMMTKTIKRCLNEKA